MTKLLTPMLILLAACTSASAAECTNISKIDFANRTLSLARAQQAAVPGGRAFGGPAVGQVFHFHQGVAVEYEGGDGKEPDWQTTIRQDVVAKPEASRTIRFLTLFRNHLTGSGSWTYLVGFACSGGRIQEVFQSSGMFMRVVKVSAELVEITMPVWRSAAPACCPSARKEFRYIWDRRAHRYILTRSDQMNRTSGE